MNIFRFDDEVSVPRPHAGTGLRVAQLIRAAPRLQVDVVHLAPNGRMVLGALDHRRFLGTMVGSGQVVDAEDLARDLRPGYGVLLEAGETCSVSSDEGLDAISIEGDFDVATTRVTQAIVVSDYDSDWPGWFDQLRDRLWPAVAPVALRIDHVGSTAVPGLAAKPVIDMDIVVRSPTDVAAVIERLETIGYEWRGDLGVVGREAFKPPPDRRDPPHHLYVVVEDNKAHLDHWLLRDLLRADPEARQRYASLKSRNRDLAGGDMDFYVAAKADLVAELLTRARAERGLPAATYWDPYGGRLG